MKKKLASLVSLAVVIAMLISMCALFGGCDEKGSGINKNLNTEEEVTIKVAGAWEDFAALEACADLFMTKYQNCTIEYEYLQDYNASLETRLSTDESDIDLFLTMSIQADNAFYPYAYDLYSDESIDLSQTFEGLVRNFELFNEDGSEEKHIYAIPIGAEIRGMYVNVTLLNSLGIEVPTNRAELLTACEKLAANGYVPFHSNPGSFAQQLLYPYVCSIILNNDAHDRVNNREPGISELFRDPMEFLYELVEKKYYNYKYVENELGLFTETTDNATAHYFFNIAADGDGYAKKDDVGQVPFMPSTKSFGTMMEKTKTDYHSNIEYEFILSPVGEEAGYAYLSPAHGIAINKNSSKMDWTIEFFNFLFQSENNEVLAEKHGIIPNVSNAFDIVKEQYNIPDSNIAQVGDVSFDYGFYSLITKSLIEVSKANNPKYMIENSDGTTSLYDFEHYMSNLEQRLMGTLTD